MSPRVVAATGAALLAVVVPTAPVMAEEWREHRPPGAGYRVEMPGRPRITTTKAGAILTTSAVLDRGDRSGFIASHNDYPADMLKRATAAQILDGVRRGQIGTRAVRSEHRLTIAGYPAWHLVLEDPDQRVIVTRAVLVDRRLFQLVYVGPSGTENGPDVRRFLDSFALVDR